MGRGLSTEASTRAATAVVLARDEGMRETIATIVGELSCLLVRVADTVEEARGAVSELSPSVVIVAPGFSDRDVHDMLRQVERVAPIVIVSPSAEIAIPGAVVVRAPFEVDVLLAAIEEAVVGRRSGVQRVV